MSAIRPATTRPRNCSPCARAPGPPGRVPVRQARARDPDRRRGSHRPPDRVGHVRSRKPRLIPMQTLPLALLQGSDSANIALFAGVGLAVLVVFSFLMVFV